LIYKVLPQSSPSFRGVYSFINQTLLTLRHSAVKINHYGYKIKLSDTIFAHINILPFCVSISFFLIFLKVKKHSKIVSFLGFIILILLLIFSFISEAKTTVDNLATKELNRLNGKSSLHNVKYTDIAALEKTLYKNPDNVLMDYHTMQKIIFKWADYEFLTPLQYLLLSAVQNIQIKKLIDNYNKDIHSKDKFISTITKTIQSIENKEVSFFDITLSADHVILYWNNFGIMTNKDINHANEILAKLLNQKKHIIDINQNNKALLTAASMAVLNNSYKNNNRWKLLLNNFENNDQ